MQIRALREYSAKRGWSVGKEAKEVGSGAVARTLREQLLDSARRREIDVVPAGRLDRWGRSVADLVSTLRELTELGVGFVSLTEALDLTTPAGRAMAGLLTVLSQFEREILRVRAWAGLDQARRQGKWLGRPPAAVVKTGSARDLVSRRNQQIGNRPLPPNRPNVGTAHSYRKEFLSYAALPKGHESIV